jgi:hypothetical protein
MKNSNTSNKARATSTSSDAWDALNYVREQQNEEATQAYDHDFFPKEDEDEDDMECRVYC